MSKFVLLSALCFTTRPCTKRDRKETLTPCAKRYLRKMNKENKALELFQYGYEDSVIAARVELPIEDVKELRKTWDRRNK